MGHRHAVRDGGTMELKQLMAEYNKKLARYYKMADWEQNASYADQLKLEQHIRQVIDDCSQALNKVREQRPVTTDEVLKGFII